MLRKRYRENRAVFWLLAAVLAVMLCFNFMTPLVADDFGYSFSLADGQRVDSLLDIPPSMAAQWRDMGGRIVAHSLAQLFLLLPKAVFNLVNAAMALALLLLLRRFCGSPDGAGGAVGLLTAVFLLWRFTPDFGQVFLWLDGACNYGWSMIAVLLFLLRYYSEYTGRARASTGPGTAGFLLLALIAGAYSESASSSALFVAAAVTALVWYEKRKAPVTLLLGLLAAALGFAFMMASPAELGTRSGSFELSALMRSFKYVLECSTELMLIPFALACALTALAAGYGADRKALIFALLLLLAAAASVLVFTFAVYFPARGFCPAAIYLTLVSLLMLEQLRLRGRKGITYAVAGALAAVFIFSFAAGALDIAVVFKGSRERKARIDAALSAGETVIELEPYHWSTQYSAPAGLTDISDGVGEWPNDVLAKYYGLDGVTLKK